MLNTKSDVVYRTVGQLAGVNVLFDPDYTPRAINVDLNGVTLEEALGNHRARIEDLLAPRYDEYHLCGARQSRQAQGA